MKTIHYVKRFKKDIKRIQKSGKEMTKLKQLIDQLLNGETLDATYCDHVLTGMYQNYRDCHIEPDWLLIYQSTETELEKP